MRIARLIAILGMVFLVSGVGVARAGTISLLASVGGPGGFGFGGTTTGAPNNDNSSMVLIEPNIIFLTEIFMSIAPAPIDAVFTVVPSTATTEYRITDITVNNTTGTTWNDFHFTLGFGSGSSFIPSGADSLDFDTPDKDPTPTSLGFITLVHGDDNIDWSGGTVPSGGSVHFALSIDVPNGITSFTLRAVPTVAAVPEPSTLVLASSGLLGMLGYGWWRRKRADR